MSTHSLIWQEGPQVWAFDPELMSEALLRLLAKHLMPLLLQLDAQLDKRLVRTFARLVQTIITFRDRVNALLLTELGEHLGSAQQTPAAVKRISHLLRSPKWSSSLIREYLLQRAHERLEQWEAQQLIALLVWDSSQQEKAESIHNEEYCAVRSTKAARLKRIKKGFYTPPSGPVFVPGLHWEGVLLVGLSTRQDPPQVAAMRWWTSRGVHASFQRDEQGKLLVELKERFGRRVIHIFDSGFAGSFWLGVLLGLELRFIMRWKSSYKLLDEQGCLRKTWEIARGKPSWEKMAIWDARKQCLVPGGIVAFPVRHPDHPEHPLWLVVCRSQDREPWYLLTAELASTPTQAWPTYWAYARRWQVEEEIKDQKSELGFESPRVQAWETREKLLLIATLAYDFLLSLLHPWLEPLRTWCIETFCPRTGRHLRLVKHPFVRLRKAVRALWQAYPPQALLPREPPVAGRVIVTEEKASV
ncbi:hypothetical protein [Ktedonobacter sp. SOSP1-85]|uniref:hypothetical protein n=1 Tax=Ktedonobacter sp. SOSP1-85 TaxID=2778367 RepID=UPI001916C4E1|nr:hypothetical protein [Ktedonobacter sp. SOSP1-85]